MQLVNKNIDYAVRALLYLGLHPNVLISAREISEQDGIPLQFARRILQELCKAGLVVSKAGATGGHMLASAPSEMKLTDVVKLFHGDFKLSQCMFRDQLCPRRATCVIRKRILRIEKIVEDEFNGITIQTLIDDMELENETADHSN